MALLLKWWPKNNLELFEKCGLDGALKERVEGWNTELRSLSTSKFLQLHAAVCAGILEAEEVQEVIENKTNSEATYCGHMKKHWEGRRADANRPQGAAACARQDLG